MGKIHTILNTLIIDAFFLKITALSNVNNEKIKETQLDRRINIYGAHADIFVTSLGGVRIPASGNQLSSPGVSLQLPYIHIGLGRTNNYVEDLAVSVFRKVHS